MIRFAFKSFILVLVFTGLWVALGWVPFVDAQGSVKEWGGKGVALVTGLFEKDQEAASVMQLASSTSETPVLASETTQARPLEFPDLSGPVSYVGQTLEPGNIYRFAIDNFLALILMAGLLMFASAGLNSRYFTRAKRGKLDNPPAEGVELALQTAVRRFRWACGTIATVALLSILTAWGENKSSQAEQSVRFASLQSQVGAEPLVSAGGQVIVVTAEELTHLLESRTTQLAAATEFSD